MNWNQLLADCVSFTQRLIQTPSMPYEEASLASLVSEEMQQLGFDEVWQDESGNVYGRIHGQNRHLPALVLNTHLDHVDPGDPTLWTVPAFSGEIVNGRIIGRGAADIKGPLAVQIFGMAALLQQGIRPQRDIVFTGVVEEEIGGTGSQYWVEHLDYPVAAVILGEPSDNQIALGHRGITQLWVQFNGRSVHASVPAKGDNPNYALASFLHKLEQEQDQLSRHELLGQTTVAPTIIEVDTKSKNVTPAWARVLLDFRTASESMHSLETFIQHLAGTWPHTITPAWHPDTADPEEVIYGFYTPPEHEVVQRARTLITQGTGQEPGLTSYNFATDGRLFVPYHIPVIGYSPAEEAQAHIAGESIEISKMAHSLRGHAALLQDF